MESSTFEVRNVERVPRNKKHYLNLDVQQFSKWNFEQNGDFFNFLLTAHRSIILDNDQLDTQFFYFTIRLL